MSPEAPHIRPWRPADLDDLVDLVAVTRRTDPVYAAAIGPTTLEALSWLGAAGPTPRWVVEVASRVVGTVEVAPMSRPGELSETETATGAVWELRRLLVHPDYQRCGLGGALVSTARAWAETRREEIWLSCRSPLVAMYERLGWSVVGELTFSSTGLAGFWMTPDCRGEGAGMHVAGAAGRR